MGSTFADFKNAYKSGAAKDQAKKIKQATNSFVDEREWKLKKNEDGTGGANIRFLPQKDIDKEPFVKIFYHNFKIGNKWFISDCPKTLDWDAECVCCDYAEPIWEEYNEMKDVNKSKADKLRDKASIYGRKKAWVSNIKVIDDPAEPTNNGKTFLYRFGKSIMDIIDSIMTPESELDDPIYPYNPFDGVNFKLRTKKVDGHQKYTTSSFEETITPAYDNESEFEDVFTNKLVDLTEFEDKIKNIDVADMNKRFNMVLGKKAGKKSTESIPDNLSTDDLFDDETPETPKDESKSTNKKETPEPSNDDIFDDETPETPKDEVVKKENKSTTDKVDEEDFDDIDFDDIDDINF